MAPRIVHLVRHGQVYNPESVLYGRLPGYGLSDLGHQMANRLGEYFADAPLVYLACSPLQRAQETMAPIAAGHPELPVHTEERVIEAANTFEGQSFGKYNQLLLKPTSWWALRNPLRPSWGESYQSIVARMKEALADAAEHADGGEVLIVAHELPIWMARSWAEGRSVVHDPRKRETRLASVTTFTFDGAERPTVSYAEPARDLLPAKKRRFRPGA